jgi:acyl-CoA reductase-like NAD-dependent aldehyde dehydrogenase
VSGPAQPASGGFARPHVASLWRLHVGGTWVDSQAGERFTTFDPSTAEPISEVATGHPADIAGAVETASAAQAGWAAQEAESRVAVLHRAAALLRDRAPDLGLLEALDSGKPVEQAIAQVRLTADAFDYWARTSLELRGVVAPAGAGRLNYTVRDPIGVIGVITPWNYPMLEYAESIPGALAVGNAVVLKPAALTPLTALALAELMTEGGLPPGVLNVVPGAGAVAGRALIEHDGVGMVVFTGSTEVGRTVASAAGRGLKKTWLELGGKSPNIVFADADLDAAIDASLFSFTVNQGQLCTAGTRLIAERAIHDELVQRLRVRAEEIAIGDPFEHGTKLGAMISEAQVQRVEGYVERALSEQATLVTGGRRPEVHGRCHNGAFYAPTIFTGVGADATIAREEIFGPVLAVLAFDREDEAARLANATSYGLNAAIWTSDLTRAHTVAAAMRAGTVYVNTINGGALAPHDRYNASGLGIAGGREQLAAMTRVKSVLVNLGGPTPRL